MLGGEVAFANQKAPVVGLGKARNEIDRCKHHAPSLPLSRLSSWFELIACCFQLGMNVINCMLWWRFFPCACLGLFPTLFGQKFGDLFRRHGRGLFDRSSFLVWSRGGGGGKGGERGRWLTVGGGVLFAAHKKVCHAFLSFESFPLRLFFIVYLSLPST